MNEVLGIIPARGGSKGIPGKNLRPLCGRPLIDYTFEAARGCDRLTRTILTTDSPAIAEAARAAAIEVPFLRPDELARDDTPTLPVIRHALDWLATNDGYMPDIVVLLQPTAPLRTACQIEEAVDLLTRSEADAVVSVTPVPAHHSPHWQFVIRDGEMRLFTGEPWSELIPARQLLPRTYSRDGSIYAFWRRTLEQTGSVYGRRTVPYVIPEQECINIDSMEDWILAESRMSKRMAVASAKGVE